MARRPKHGVWLLSLLTLLSLACACGGREARGPTSRDAGGDASEETPATLELGSGETAFEPTLDEQHLKLYAGTQGGHHVWLSYRARGLLPEGVRMTLDVIPAPPARPAHSEVVLNLQPSVDDDSFEFVGWPARVLDPECAVDGVVSIALTLTDTRGRQAQAAMNVIADPPDLGFPRACAL
jgi:hypothetical protein